MNGILQPASGSPDYLLFAPEPKACHRACLALACIAVVAFGSSTIAAVAAEGPDRKPDLFVTQHTGTFNGSRVSYTAAVCETIVEDAEGAATASVYSITYLADEARDPASRPVVFIFNGGPGSSSVWLHMGAFGPTRVVLPDDLNAGTSAPYALADNEQTLLDVADLVFLDPVETGFSRILAEERKSSYYSVVGDAEYLASVINRWVYDHGRESSPKYIMGESYGTIRAPMLARALYESHSRTSVNGLILLGPAVTLGETATRPGNILAYALALPYMSATAWYHGKVDPSERRFEEFLDASRQFAIMEYLPALALGRRLEFGRREEIAAGLERFTGVSADYFLRNELAIKKTDFRFELLRDEGRILGVNDSRYTAADAGGLQGDEPVDPSMHAVVPAYAAGIARHLRDNLGVELSQPYLIFDRNALPNWDWGPPPSPFSNFSWAGVLAGLMKGNPGLRLFYGVGYYDPLTTIGATEYTVNRADHADERVELHYYQSGHMPYVDEESYAKLAGDVRVFISSDR